MVTIAVSKQSNSNGAFSSKAVRRVTCEKTTLPQETASSDLEPARVTRLGLLPGCRRAARLVLLSGQKSNNSKATGRVTTTGFVIKPRMRNTGTGRYVRQLGLLV